MHSVFFQRAEISNFCFACGRALQFVGEEKQMFCKCCLLFDSCLMPVAWIFVVKPYANCSEPP